MANTPTHRLANLSRYIFGTARLRGDNFPLADRIKIVRAAMDAGVWFHTSHQYGNALEVLRAAFDEDRAHVPRLIAKIGWNTIDEMREVIREHLQRLGIEHIDIGQLCLGGDLADQFRTGGKCYDDFRRLKEEGIVREFVLEIFPWTSRGPLEAIKAAYPASVVDGYIFYLNPLQRFAANPLWELLRDRNEPIIAMRTVGGGTVHRLRDVPGAAWKDYLRQRAVEVAPIFEESACKTWTEFCVRFAFGIPQVVATVGATRQMDNLQQFFEAVRDVQPLPQEIQAKISALQARWSDDVDVHAEPWSM